jgi:hypothetical protein
MSDYRFHHPQEEELHAYLDGELAAGQTGALLEHLEECAKCRQALSELQALFTQIESVADLPLEVDYAPVISARLDAGRRSKRGWRLVFAAQVAAAGVLSWIALPAMLPQIGQWLGSLRGWTSGLDLQPALGSILIMIQDLAAELPHGIFGVFEITIPVRIAPWLAQEWWLLLLPGGVLWLVLNHWLLGRQSGSIDSAPTSHGAG